MKGVSAGPVAVRVPATTANLGPGFDALGMALSLYNRFEVERLPAGYVVETAPPAGAAAGAVPGAGAGAQLPRARTIWSSRPRRRLGGPWACRLRAGGCGCGRKSRWDRGWAARPRPSWAASWPPTRSAGGRLSREEMLDIAVRLEGHPDNVTPALLGGFTVAVMDGPPGGPDPAARGGPAREPSVVWQRFEVRHVDVVVAVPDQPLATGRSRRALPETVPYADAVFNVGRASLLTAAMAAGDAAAMAVALEDRLHQPYRAPLVPGFYDVVRAAKAGGGHRRGAQRRGAVGGGLCARGRPGGAHRHRDGGGVSRGGHRRPLAGAAARRRRRSDRGRGDAMNLVVQKYGGSSVATPERVKAVARRIVEAKRAGRDVVAVVSAMGDTTDELIALAHQVSPAPPRRELDMLLATGEQMSSALLAMAIHDLGEAVVSLTGSQVGIITDGTHTKAKILRIDPSRVRRELARGKIAIVAGFQGQSLDESDITTLGRGGSDTTAVALAAALGADVCEIYTDVEGVFTATRGWCPKPASCGTSPTARCWRWPAWARWCCSPAASRWRRCTASPSTSAPASATRKGRT